MCSDMFVLGFVPHPNLPGWLNTRFDNNSHLFMEWDVRCYIRKNCSLTRFYFIDSRFTWHVSFISKRDTKRKELII